MSGPEQWLPSASDQEDRVPIGEDVPRAYIDGRDDGRREEGARIRRELLAWIEAHNWKEDGIGKPVVPHRGLLDALDKIAPEEVSRG